MQFVGMPWNLCSAATLSARNAKNPLILQRNQGVLHFYRQIDLQTKRWAGWSIWAWSGNVFRNKITIYAVFSHRSTWVRCMTCGGQIASFTGPFGAQPWSYVLSKFAWPINSTWRRGFQHIGSNTATLYQSWIWSSRGMQLNTYFHQGKIKQRNRAIPVYKPNYWSESNNYKSVI